MKRCSRCQRRKPLREFYRRGRKYGDERGTECRTCCDARHRAWTEESKAWIRDFARGCRRKGGRVIDQAKAFVKSAQNLKLYYRLQHDAMLAYGGYCCACCGIAEPLFLSIDHVNAGGGRHRRQTGTGVYFYKWLQANGYPKGFQVLCSNCNHGRHRNGGVCPHKTDQRKVSRVRAPRGG